MLLALYMDTQEVIIQAPTGGHLTNTLVAVDGTLCLSTLFRNLSCVWIFLGKDNNISLLC